MYAEQPVNAAMVGWMKELSGRCWREGVKNPFSCAYRFIKLYGQSAQRGKGPHQREHTQELYDTTEKQLFLFFCSYAYSI